MHSNIAECSESIGIKLTLWSLTKFLIISPATTNVSLFANKISFLALIAQIVGSKPEIPTNALTKISLSYFLYDDNSFNPSSP